MAKASAKEHSNVLNSTIGNPYSLYFTNYTEKQRKYELASLFEQLLLFDKVTINTNRINQGLYELIKLIGINTVEELIDRDYINFMIWTLELLTLLGQKVKYKKLTFVKL